MDERHLEFAEILLANLAIPIIFFRSLDQLGLCKIGKLY
jgi:hypothetical protein